MILETLHGKTCFVIGGSGFLGSTLVCRLVFDTDVSGVYVLCRGGSERLFKVWAKNMSPAIAQSLRDSNKIICYDGDITKPNLGMSDSEVTTIRQNVQIFIHSAFSINLCARISRLIAPIGDASLTATNLARSCEKFEKFIYVSTAFSNSHFHQPATSSTPEISEELHTLRSGALKLQDVEDEYQRVIKHGDLEKSYRDDFPWAYGYAKHLTERLLTNKFMDKSGSLLIVRPSIIGPAQSYPYPGYEVPGSAPLTMIAAAVLLEPSRMITLASPFADPMSSRNPPDS